MFYAVMMGSTRLRNQIERHKKSGVLKFENQCIKKMFDSSIFKGKKDHLITLNILISCFIGDKGAYKYLMSKTLKQTNFKEYHEILLCMNKEDREIRSKEEMEKKSLLDFINPTDCLMNPHKNKLFIFMEKLLENICDQTNRKTKIFWKDPFFSLQIIRIFAQGNYCDLFKMIYSDKDQNVQNRYLLTQWLKFEGVGLEEHKQLQLFLLLLIFTRNQEMDLTVFQENLKEHKRQSKKIKMSIAENLDVDFLYCFAKLIQNDFSDFIRLEATKSNPLIACLYAWIHIPKYMCKFLDMANERKPLSVLLGLLIFYLALPFLNLESKDEVRYNESIEKVKTYIKDNLIDIFAIITHMKQKQDQTVHWYSYKTIAVVKGILNDLKEMDIKEIKDLFEILEKAKFEKSWGLFMGLLEKMQPKNENFAKFKDFLKLFVIFSGYSKFDVTEVFGENDKISNLLGNIKTLFNGEKVYHFELLTTGLAMGLDIMAQKKRNKFINSDFWISKLTNIL